MAKARGKRKGKSEEEEMEQDLHSNHDVDISQIGKPVTAESMLALVEGLNNNPHAAGRVYDGKKLSERFLVLGIKELALQWLLDSNGIYLGKTYQFSGKTASCKSQFGYEVGMFFLQAGGIFILVETENKTSPSTLKAKFGALYDCGRFFYHQVDFTDLDVESRAELWQKAVSFWIKKLKDLNMAHAPTWILVDSLVGTGSAESNKQIIEDGGAEGRSTSGMVRASSNTKYMALLTKTIIDTGISVAFTNHLKDETQEKAGVKSYGPKKGIVGGGDAVGFGCATMLDFARGSAQGGVSDAGRFVHISVRKGSFGKDFQHIQVPFDVYIQRDEDGNVVNDERGDPIRRITWDWDEAFTLLLEQFCLGDGDYKVADANKIVRMQKGGGKYSSKRLKVENLTATEFGQAAAANREMLYELQCLPRFNINQYKLAAGESRALSLVAPTLNTLKEVDAEVIE
jgi:hypothetical protein